MSAFPSCPFYSCLQQNWKRTLFLCGLLPLEFHKTSQLQVLFELALIGCWTGTGFELCSTSGQSCMMRSSQDSMKPLYFKHELTGLRPPGLPTEVAQVEDWSASCAIPDRVPRKPLPCIHASGPLHASPREHSFFFLASCTVNWFPILTPW